MIKAEERLAKMLTFSHEKTAEAEVKVVAQLTSGGV